jgi:hypothetical protein
VDPLAIYNQDLDINQDDLEEVDLADVEDDTEADIVNQDDEVDELALVSDSRSAKDEKPNGGQTRNAKVPKTPTADLEPVKKRSRGRPRKSHEEKRPFSALIYIQVGSPPVLQRGKTHKGDKLVPQKPITKGPFTLTRDMKWSDFLDGISDATQIEKENLQVDGISWAFQRQKDCLPLTNKDAFKAMRRMVKERKGTNIIMVNHPIPRTATTRPQPDSHRAQEDNSHWDQKV